MKKFLIVLIICVFNLQNAQIAIPIFKENKEVFGYATFKPVSKASKNYIYKMEIQDVNLNKINEVLLKTDFKVLSFDLCFNGKKLLIECFDYDDYKTLLKDFRYFIYDIKENKISECLQMDFAKENRNNIVQKSFPINEKGFTFFFTNGSKQETTVYSINNENEKISENAIYFLNEKNKRTYYQYLRSGTSDNIMVHCFFDNTVRLDGSYQLLFYNSGELLKTIKLSNGNKRELPKSIIVKDKEVFVFGDTYTFINNNLQYDGFFLLKYDSQGNEISNKTITWNDLKPFIKINEHGIVENLGSIYSHEFKIDKTSNHIILVGETFQRRPSKINDMIFLDFDESFELKAVKNFNKTFSRSNTGLNYGNPLAEGTDLKALNYFDYEFSNDLVKNNGLAFFFKNTDQKDGLFTNGKYNYGIISYKNNEFSRDDINFTSQNYSYLLPSKPGYFLIYELQKDENVEKRIEKINN